MTYYTLGCKGHVLAQLEAGGGLGTMSIPNTNTPLHRLTHVISTVSSVDEVDCRGVASRFISSFLSSRSQSPMRTMVLARESICFM
jgi:hypothetical protein